MRTDASTVAPSPERGARRAMIVTTNFPPDASVGTLRTLRLVRHLAEAGWRVDVITAAPERFRAGTVIDMALLEKVPRGVEVSRARAWRPVERLGTAIRRTLRGGGGRSPAGAPSTTGDGRQGRVAGGWLRQMTRATSAAMSLPDREVSWLLPAVAAGWRHVRRHRPDVLYSSGPPFTAHFVAAVLARLSRRPWVADFRDPWARAPWRHDRFAFERKAWSVLERRVVTRANAVLFVAEMNRMEFARHYGDALASRFHVVPNGCEPGDFDGLARRQPASADPFVLLHAGSLYGARNPAALLTALERAIRRGSIDRTRIRLRFIGRVGVPGVSLPHVARELGLDDVVEFADHVPRRAVLQEMLDASALLIVQPVTTVSVPAKLYEYMAAGRPVLALAEADGETAMLVRQHGAGLVVPPDDEDAIERALVALVAGSGQFVPVDRARYDGALRAREIGQILSDVADDPVGASHAVRAAGSSAPTEVTRS